MPKWLSKNRTKPLLLSIVSCLLFPSIARTQIVPDASLPNNSRVAIDGQTRIITGGTRVGSNVFHSFEQFSLSTGNAAWFDNSVEIQNIIARVTGQSISSIDGLIGANGAANLFLLNPNGIVFGAGAKLDIGGSFIASTASSIKLSDGSYFDASNTQAPPLLTINVPVGLQYGTNPGEIRVQGSGHSLRLNPETRAFIKSDRPTGLQVPAGQTLALVGGDVAIEGGNLTAEGGRIELGSVENSLVALTPTESGFELNYSEVENFRDIQIARSGSVDTSGNSGGDIQIRARGFRVTDGSAILADTAGAGSGGILAVRASESVELVGTSDNSANMEFPSTLSASVEPTAIAQALTCQFGLGGNIEINTSLLRVADGAVIFTTTFGEGNAGNLSVRANSIQLIGTSGDGRFFSGLFTLTESGATGNAGDLEIDTSRLLVANGALLSAATYGAGDGGNITIRADSLEAIGRSASSLIPSALATSVEPGASGRGGNMEIFTSRLLLANGSSILGSTFAEGDAGNVTVETKELLALDGSQISASTIGAGDAGNLTVRAEVVELSGARQRGRSGLFSAALNGTGDGGQIAIASDRLIIRDGATISASNFQSRNLLPPGRGSSGNIQVTANSIQLSDEASITAEAAAGDKGSINLQAASIQLRRNSQIVTNAIGLATGGNITINAETITALENSDISANAEQSFGGRVSIATRGLFGTEFRRGITPRSDITATSDLGADFDGTVDIQTPEIDPTSGLLNLSEYFVDAEGLIGLDFCSQSQDSQFIATGRGGLPPNPAAPLSNETILLEWWTADSMDSTIIDETGKFSLESVANSGEERALFDSPSSPPVIREAQGWYLDSDGAIVLTADPPKVTPNRSRLIHPGC